MTHPRTGTSIPRRTLIAAGGGLAVMAAGAPLAEAGGRRAVPGAKPELPSSFLVTHVIRVRHALPTAPGHQ